MGLEQLIPAVRNRQCGDSICILELTKTMPALKAKSLPKIKVSNYEIVHVTDFEYLGSVIGNNDGCTKQVKVTKTGFG